MDWPRSSSAGLPQRRQKPVSEKLYLSSSGSGYLLQVLPSWHSSSACFRRRSRTKIQVFDSILFDEQSLWLVVAVFYVLDNLKQLPSQSLILQETWNLSWRAHSPSDTLMFLQRRLVLLNIFLPYTRVLPLEWLTAEPDNQSRIRRADRFLRVSARKIFSLRCISAVCFIAFFVAGPLLTYWRGLTYALLQVAPIYVASLALLSFTLMADRKFWKLTPSRIIASAFEAAVCPAYLANAAHRISWNHIRIDVDGGAYGLLRCPPHFHADLKSTLNFALEQLEEQAANNEQQRDRLSAYRESVLR